MNSEQKVKSLNRLIFWRGGYFGTNELITLIISNGRLSIDSFL